MSSKTLALPTITLSMIVKDEGVYLYDCLESVKSLVDEVIVVDTGSTDDTTAIARSFGASVIEFPWTGDFSKARNASIAGARSDWILFLDADERIAHMVPPQTLKKFLRQTKCHAFQVQIDNLKDDGTIESFQAVRLFRNHPGVKFRYKIHEQILDSVFACFGEVRSHVGHLDLLIQHMGYQENVVQNRGKRIRDETLLVDQLRETPNNILMHYFYIRQLVQRGALDAALEASKQAVTVIHKSRRFPLTVELTVPEIFALKGYLHLKANQYDEALQSVAEGLAHRGDYINLIFVRGNVFHAMKDLKRARDDFMWCRDYRPDNLSITPWPGVDSYESCYNLAKIEMESGDFDAAKTHLDAAIKSHPSHVNAHRLYAIIEMMQKRYIEAIDHFTKVASLAPQDITPLVGISMAALEINDLERSYDAATRILAIDSTAVVGLERLGEIALYRGDICEAQTAWKRLAPNFTKKSLAGMCVIQWILNGQDIMKSVDQVADEIRQLQINLQRFNHPTWASLIHQNLHCRVENT